jgi:hypothetical protein
LTGDAAAAVGLALPGDWAALAVRRAARLLAFRWLTVGLALEPVEFAAAGALVVAVVRVAVGVCVLADGLPLELVAGATEDVDVVVRGFVGDLRCFRGFGAASGSMYWLSPAEGLPEPEAIAGVARTNPGERQIRAQTTILHRRPTTHVLKQHRISTVENAQRTGERVVRQQLRCPRDAHRRRSLL